MWGLSWRFFGGLGRGESCGEVPVGGHVGILWGVMYAVIRGGQDALPTLADLSKTLNYTDHIRVGIISFQFDVI